MAERGQQDFNRSALTVRCGRAWYTGQRAEKIPVGLVGVVGDDCTSLDLSYNELTSITAVKHFQKLQELILDNNKLRDLKTLPRIPTLTTLSLNNNKITDIDAALKRIQECCPNVAYVSLLGNPGCPDQLTNPSSTDEEDYDRYRLYAIYTLPASLRFLDSRPVTRQERTDAERRGKFSRTVKLVPELSSKFVPNPIEEFDDIFFNVHYTPLPTSIRNPLDHKGIVHTGSIFLAKKGVSTMLATFETLGRLYIGQTAELEGKIGVEINPVPPNSSLQDTANAYPIICPM